MRRHNAREIALHLVFSMSSGFSGTADELLSSRLTQESFDSLKNEVEVYSEFPDENQQGYIESIIKGIYEHIQDIDSAIEKYSLGWKMSRISKISASILRLSAYEILYMNDIPTGASINEAVEFAKAYDSNESAAFVNGILGSLVREEQPKVERRIHD